jgi:chromosome partitioning protein
MGSLMIAPLDTSKWAIFAHGYPIAYTCGVARVVAVANQKGGVGKTTTTHALASVLARRDWRVLLVDLDPQACLTYSLGVDPDDLGHSVHDVLLGRMQAREALHQVKLAPVRADLGIGLHGEGGERQDPFVSLLPATIDLAGSEVFLSTRTAREHVLERALAPLQREYDWILVDCAPSLGVLTINGLTAARGVVIPVPAEALGRRGVGQLLETIEDVRSFANSKLEVIGMVVTMLDERLRHSREVLSELQELYGVPVLEPFVPRSVRFAEAPEQARSIVEHAPGSRGAAAYAELAEQLESWSG